MMVKFTFSSDPETKKFVLSLFGKSVDHDNKIVEETDGQPVLDMNGQYISLDEFGGIRNGSEIFVKDDIASLADFYTRYLQETA